MYKLSIYRPDTWWVNFTDSITTPDFDLGNFRREVEYKLQTYEATLMDGFWGADDNEYISFENKEDMTAFLLRWS